jgi:hypothetical protein
VGDPPPLADTLPVASLPLREGEDYYVHRGKIRPAVVVSTGGNDLAATLRMGQRWQTARCFLAAPFYGADSGTTRGGWLPEFVTRIRRAEYPQYIWDSLPDTSVSESIMRLDHLMPIGADPASYRTAPYRLSDEALQLLDEWVSWLITGSLQDDSVLGTLRTGLLAST